jgi:hypothetical protein
MGSHGDSNIIEDKSMVVIFTILEEPELEIIAVTQRLFRDDLIQIQRVVRETQ